MSKRKEKTLSAKTAASEPVKELTQYQLIRMQEEMQKAIKWSEEYSNSLRVDPIRMFEPFTI